MYNANEPSVVSDLPNEINNLTLMINASIDCIKIVDKSGNLMKINSAGARALGISHEHIPENTNWANLLPPDIRATARSSLKKIFDGINSSFPGRSELKGKSTIHWDNVLTPIFGGDGSVQAALCLSRDVTRQREAELKLKEASELDQLTKLANRRLFTLTLTNRLRTYQKNQTARPINS